MLYYIVPPIIIVLSSAILIVFFFKKFSKGENIDPNILKNLRDSGSSIGFWSRMLAVTSNLWLRFLEKMMQRTKLFSLKVHNTSNTMFHSVKNKREKSSKVIVEIQNNKNEKEKEDEDVFKREVDVVRKPIESVEKSRRFFRRRKEVLVDKPEKIEKISRKRGTIFSKKESKEEVSDEILEKTGMEEDLIRRIAVNPKDIEAYERLGDYYSDIKEFRDSIECYKQVLRLSPDHKKARMKMKSLEIILKK